MPGSAIGIIPNPMSGRDIRRIVSQASVFPNTEKTSMVLRILRAAGGLGVERVLLSTDTFGIAARCAARNDPPLHRPVDRAHPVAEVEFLELTRPTGTAADTREYARIMTRRFAISSRFARPGRSAAIVLLGGDGTMRAAAPGLGDTPMLALSTGTNNAFPIMIEATVAGMALGLIATGAAAARPAGKLLHVEITRADGSTVHEVALVDVCVSTSATSDLARCGRSHAARAVLHVRRTARDRPVRHPRPGSARPPATPTWRRRDARRPRIRRAHRARTDRAGPDRAGRASAPPARSNPGSPNRSASTGAPSPSTASARSSSAPATGSASPCARDGPRVIDVPALLAQHADIATRSCPPVTLDPRKIRTPAMTQTLSASAPARRRPPD